MMRQSPEEYVSRLRHLLSRAKGSAARRVAASFRRDHPEEFLARYFFAVTLSEFSSGLSRAEIARNRKKTLSLLRKLLRERRTLTPEQSDWVANEYYWFSGQPERQYALGLRGLRSGLPAAEYSRGVGAAMLALKSAERNDARSALKWSKRSLSAWRRYHNGHKERLGSLLYEAVARGAAGNLASMERRLTRAAALAQISPRNHELQWARRVVRRALGNRQT